MAQFYGNKQSQGAIILEFAKYIKLLSIIWEKTVDFGSNVWIIDGLLQEVVPQTETE